MWWFLFCVCARVKFIKNFMRNGISVQYMNGEGVKMDIGFSYQFMSTRCRVQLSTYFITFKWIFFLSFSFRSAQFLSCFWLECAALRWIPSRRMRSNEMISGKKNILLALRHSRCIPDMALLIVSFYQVGVGNPVKPLQRSKSKRYLLLVVMWFRWPTIYFRSESRGSYIFSSPWWWSNFSV